MPSRAPAGLTAVNYTYAKRPTLGGNLEVFLSTKLSYELGTLLITDTDTGSWAEEASGAAQLLADPRDLIAVCKTKLDGDDEDVTFTVNGTDASDQAITATVTFTPPPYVSDQGKHFPNSFAVDVVEGSDEAFKTITSITAVNAQAAAINAKIKLFAVPKVTDFTALGCRTDLNYALKARLPKSVQCGFDKSAFTVQGETEEAQLDLTSKLFNHSQDLARYNGRDVTVLVKNTHAETIVTEHMFFIGALLTVTGRAGEGEDEATLEATGRYEDLAIMPAYAAA